MSVEPGVYLNTDCLINALHGRLLDRQTLAEAVAGRRVVTSWFVRFEYLRTVVYAFVFFEHLLRTEETIEDVLVAFFQQQRPQLEAVVRYGTATDLRGHPKRSEIEQILNR